MRHGQRPCRRGHIEPHRPFLVPYVHDACQARLEGPPRERRLKLQHGARHPVGVRHGGAHLAVHARGRHLPEARHKDILRLEPQAQHKKYGG
ncbi:MAG: hypothetical protein IKU04_05740 [Bacteroidales bacterium]|nr:hypothetical protein [Bacteroidales bacterium]